MSCMAQLSAPVDPDPSIPITMSTSKVVEQTVFVGGAKKKGGRWLECSGNVSKGGEGF